MKLMGPPPKPVLERIMAKMLVDADTGCWIFTGKIRKDGYGQTHADGHHLYVHRVAYVELVGPIPEGMLVLHECDNRSCFNPKHLFLGDNKANTADMFAKRRQHSRKGECSGMAKLTDVKVLSIRADTRTQKEIAAEYGVDQSLVSYVKARKIWNHVK